MEDFEVSIIVAVHDSESHIRFTLSSLCQVMDLENISGEILVVDNGSTDKTADEVRSYMREHPEIHLLTEERQPWAKVRNIGLQAARGRYVLFLDCGEVVIPGLLGECLRRAVFYNTDIIVSGCLELSQREFDGWVVKGFTYDRGNITLKEVSDEEFLKNTYMCSGTYSLPARYLIRRQFLEDYGVRFNERLGDCAAQFFAIDLVLAAQGVWVTDEPGTAHVVDNCCRSLEQERRESLDMKWWASEAMVFQGHPTIDTSDVLREILSTTVSAKAFLATDNLVRMGEPKHLREMFRENRRMRSKHAGHPPNDEEYGVNGLWAKALWYLYKLETIPLCLAYLRRWTGKL